MLAFPPTESYFKKWWEWYINWVFMGPIVMLLLWMAGEVGRANCSGNAFNFTRAIATLALVYLAAIVPGKLGGAVMGAYTGALKGAGKKAWDNPWSNRQKKLIGGKMAERFSRTKLGGMMARSRMAQENEIANNEGLVGSRDQQHLAKHLDRTKDRQKLIDREIEHGKNAVENIRKKAAFLARYLIRP
jgi:hypothetical protein